jgi:S1-C subfamily serine protease
MPFDEDAEELPGFRPPPHPDDRLWRHPSEMRAYPIVPVGAPGRPPRSRVVAGHGRPWFTLVAAGTAGAVLAGVGVVALGVGERVVDQPVTERVALNPVAAAPGLKRTSVHDIRRLVTPGVVGIGRAVTADPQGTSHEMRGSGVVVRDDGIVVTSAALLTHGDVWARLPDGTTVRGDLVGSDPTTGLGLVDLRGKGFTTSVLAEEGDLMAGEVSYGVTARPDGGTITAPGTVGRAVRYVGPTGGALDGIAVTGKPATLALGGALADPRGAVVGIATAVDGDETGGWFVMPVEAVDKVVDDLLTDGTVHGCWLGIEGADTPDPAQAGSVDGGGTSVTSVIDDSPAALGGLAVGDVVVGLDDRPVNRMPDLNVALRSHSPGDRVDVDVVRAGGSRVTLVITLGEAPTAQALAG